MLRKLAFAALAFGIVLGGLLALPETRADRIDGNVRVLDGDTLVVDGVTVRLFGIDAPEHEQTCALEGAPPWDCGAWVSREVRARYGGRTATCEAMDLDRYGRTVARCFVDGEDIAQRLVRDGLAFAFRKYAFDYDLDEKTAAVQGVGLHGAGLQSPGAYRAEIRAQRAQSYLQTAPDGCTIKGNISADGKRIFHQPGQAWYDATRIEPERGEKWFCSAAEARAAGWRAARK